MEEGGGSVTREAGFGIVKFGIIGSRYDVRLREDGYDLENKIRFRDVPDVEFAVEE